MLLSFHKDGDVIKYELMHRFIQFFYNHMYRTPEHHQPFIDEFSSEESVLGSIARLERKYGEVSEDVKNKLLSKNAMSDRENKLRISSLGRQSSIVLEAFTKMYLMTASPENSRKQFIIGSNPVIRMCNSDDQSVSTGDIEFWTTFTSNLAVGFTTKKPLYNRIKLSDQMTEHLNTSILSQSTCVAAKNKKLLASLVSKPTKQA